MKLTNKYGLPQPIESAVKSYGYPPDKNRIGVTDLIAAPLVRQLKIEHWDNITEDVSDKIWMLMGNAVHYILHKASDKSVLAEESLQHNIDDMTVAGRPDLLEENGILSDYKITSVYSFILGDKIEWENQLNVYRWLYEKHGFKITKLKIVAILRDWSKNKSDADDYPDIPVYVKEVPMWDMDKTEEYVRERVRLHRNAQNGAILACTAPERWAKPEKYAVHKRGRKRALRLFDTVDQAKAFIGINTQEHYIDHRPAKYTKCESYCTVREVCSYRNLP